MKARLVFTTAARTRCACTLVKCPHPPQVGDPLCAHCRQVCAPELDRLAARRRKRIMWAILVALGAASWAVGHFAAYLVGG